MAKPVPALLFVDDGHPESRDYDDNYVPVVVDGSRVVRPVPEASAVSTMRG